MSRHQPRLFPPLVVLLVGLVACAGPRDEDVRVAFAQENPTYSIISVAPGEGDSSTVYMNIRYRRPGTSPECVVTWGYQEKDQGWSIFHKGTPVLADTACEGCSPKPCV